VQGSSSETDRSGNFIYDGAALAEHEHAVVVTINYRIGALGWLAHPAFGDHPGNYGTLDQIFALQWTRRNVAAFGGDPTRVLIFGESAGALNVCVLLASPLAKGLFSAALMESGGCSAKTAAAAQTFAPKFMVAAGCEGSADPAECARGLSAEAVTLALPQPANVAGAQSDYQPNVDGVVLLDTPQAVLAAGTHNHVPFVVGSNSEETSLALAQANPGGMTDAQYRAAVLAYAFGNPTLADQVLAMYPVTDYSSPLAAYAAVTSDAKFICTARIVARAARAAQSEPVYRYFFMHHLDNAAAAVRALGAWHGLELAFVFRDLGAVGYAPSAAENALADAIGGYWARLAATGDPNEGAAPAWPVYDVAEDSYLALDDAIQSGAGVRTSYCDFWDSVLSR
jgi:para-nitrobenzyl esterase